MSIPATPIAPHPRAPDLSGCALDGRYELHALIGEGAFGRVYRGRDRRLARAVAVKVIKPWWADDEDWVQGFEREAQLMARVSNPGIVQIFDVGYASEGLYYVAELVDGASLQERLRAGPMAPGQASEVAEQLCRALGHAHAQRIVHRDVKPANVLISRHGAVKVGDFGVARLGEGSSEVLAATIVGTPKYMAPEQARGRGTSAATDVYSVGIVLYEMLAGRPPFEGGSPVELALAHLHDPHPALPPSVPGPLAGVVERALAKDPAGRYADGAEMAGALEAARSSSSPRPASATRNGTTASTAAAPTAVSPSEPIDPTRVAPRMSPRRNVNPAGRRRSIALLGGVILLVIATLVAVAVTGAVGRVRVPDLRGMTRATITARTRRLDLRFEFAGRYSGAPRGTAIQQTPAAGTSAREGSAVRVLLSPGPAPVATPTVVGMSADQAEAVLHRLQLRASVQDVPAPGVTTGAVTNQSPATGAKLLPGSTVSLSVAEPPRWRALTTFGGPSSVPFRIHGRRWRVIYRMSYDGTCSFIFICSGPSARVVNVGDGSTAGSFDLNDGSGQVWASGTGPGVYQLRITPGSDTASWSVEVDDYY